MEVDEKMLIEGCRKCDRKAQFELFELYLPYVTSICKRYLRDQSYLKDAVQEVFLHVFRGICTSFDEDKGELKFWVRKISINCSLKFNTKHRSYETLDPDHDIKITGEPTFFQDDQLLAILKAIPSIYRDVFNLYVIDQYNHSEISELLSISESGSRKRLQRAREFIKQHFSSIKKGLYISL